MASKTTTTAQSPAPDEVLDTTPSIVDTVLNLDEFLSGDVRRAERSARFSTMPWLEADIDNLDAELSMLTDGRGTPLADYGDESVASSRSARTVALELLAVQHEYAASFRTIRFQQLDADSWAEFEERWSDTLSKGEPFDPALWDELFTRCAVKPTISAEQIAKLRKAVGAPQLLRLANAVWGVNRESGVSVPKSQLSSVVLKRTEPSKS